jgi:phosphatidate cytidylyltransferase
MRFPYMTCPAQDLGVSAWSDIHCTPNPVFLWTSFEWPSFVQSAAQSIVGREIPSIPYAPFQIHSLIMAAFASLVAPFGGFFASGFKRAFDIKDFGDSIPGHGGMTDRMDCQ